MAVGEGYLIPLGALIFIWPNPGAEYRECSEPCGDVPRSEPVSDIGILLAGDIDCNKWRS
jgi:hypothetical protein